MTRDRTHFLMLNIGHFLIGEAIFRGFDPAIREMRRLMDVARGEVAA